MFAQLLEKEGGTSLTQPTLLLLCWTQHDFRLLSPWSLRGFAVYFPSKAALPQLSCQPVFLGISFCLTVMPNFHILFCFVAMTDKFQLGC